MQVPSLSVIIPAYNESSRIEAGLRAVVGHLSEQDYTWEVLVVDDGSTDGTADLAREWAKDRPEIRVEETPHQGKGWAVRHGMLAATGERRFMCDADVAMPIEKIATFLRAMDQGYDIVIGSRQIAGARRYGEPAFRHFMGRAFNWGVRMLAVGGYQDTQCGFKCFRAEAAERLFGQQRTRGFGFDVELLYLARKRGMRVLEMPIEWHHRSDSKVNPVLDALAMTRDTAMVRLRNAWGAYPLDTRHDPPEVRRIVPTVASPRPSGNGHHAGNHEGDPRVAIVVPTYNEALNLPELTERIFGLDIPNSHVIIVDDGSPDGTARVAEGLAKQLDGKLTLLQRQGKQGVGTAYVTGFSVALEDEADYVFQMDADLSHSPEYLPGLMAALQEADVVVGSRYTPGGQLDPAWSLKRRLLSSLANIGIRKVSGLKVRDATTGFKGYRGSALRALSDNQFRCKGFGFQAEVAFACQRLGFTVAEYPIIFYDRTKGRSKMSISILLEALWRLLLLRWRRWPRQFASTAK